MIKTYSELQNYRTLKDRFEYLHLTGVVGETTFGFDRYINQMFYKSLDWKRARDAVIIRDEGCDMGLHGYEIIGRVTVHHMNPIKMEDIERDSSVICNPEYLVCVSYNTHLAIHYGNISLLPELPIERRPNDTIPWR